MLKSRHIGGSCQYRRRLHRWTGKRPFCPQLHALQGTEQSHITREELNRDIPEARISMSPIIAQPHFFLPTCFFFVSISRTFARTSVNAFGFSLDAPKAASSSFDGVNCGLLASPSTALGEERKVGFSAGVWKTICVVSDMSGEQSIQSLDSRCRVQEHSISQSYSTADSDDRLFGNF
jgi:hypothetical protein